MHLGRYLTKLPIAAADILGYELLPIGIHEIQIDDVGIFLGLIHEETEGIVVKVVDERRARLLHKADEGLHALFKALVQRMVDEENQARAKDYEGEHHKYGGWHDQLFEETGTPVKELEKESHRAIPISRLSPITQSSLNTHRQDWRKPEP